MKCDPKNGARSLLVDAIGLAAGDRLSIVAEDPALGVYDSEVPKCLAEMAEAMNVSVEIINVGDHTKMDGIPDAVFRALNESDHVLFQSRLGDAMRFDNIPGRATKTMSYALDIELLAGPACSVPHKVLSEIQRLYHSRLDCSENWHITCPLGTDIRGKQDLEKVASGEIDDFGVTRFPVCSPRPVGCDSANGMVAVANWLMGTGNRVYADDQLIIESPIFAHVEAGRIVEFSGEISEVDRVRSHYLRVADYLEIDPWIVHSWHGGLNPGAFYPLRAIDDIERFGRTAFASPRYLHFHTCGNYAPGEIAWSLFDTTVSLEDDILWDKGRLKFLEDPEVKEILAAHGIEALEERFDIGID